MLKLGLEVGEERGIPVCPRLVGEEVIGDGSAVGLLLDGLDVGWIDGCPVG